MHFILAPGKIEALCKLRKQYEVRKGRKLNDPLPYGGFLTFFGEPDLVKRKNQVLFLEKVQIVLKKFLLTDDKLDTIEQWQGKLMAAQILIATCLYIKEDIGSSKDNSILYQEINKALGISKKNYLDKEDKAMCYATAHQLFVQDNAFQTLNEFLPRESQFSKEEFDPFCSFLKMKWNKYGSKKKYDYQIPVSYVLEPIFERAFKIIGAAFGWIIGDVLSSSSAVIPSQLHLTAAIGSTLLFAGTGGTSGVLLLAPTIATRIIGSVLRFGLSGLTETTLGAVGKETAKIVALPFDFMYNSARYAGSCTGSYIIEYMTPKPIYDHIDGIRLDGVPVKEGVPIQIKFTSPQLNHKSLQLQIADKQSLIPVTEKTRSVADDGEIDYDSSREDLGMLA